MVVVAVVVVVVVAGRGGVHEHAARHFGDEVHVVVDVTPRGGGGRLVVVVALGVGDVLELLVVVVVVGGRCGRLRHEVVIRERSAHGSGSRGRGRGLDLARGVVARRAKGDLVVVVRKVELRSWVAEAHERRGVEGVRRFGLRAEASQPDALLLLWIANLGYPFPPAPHSHPAVLARARGVAPALRISVRHRRARTPMRVSNETETHARAKVENPIDPQKIKSSQAQIISPHTVIAITQLRKLPKTEQ